MKLWIAQIAPSSGQSTQPAFAAFLLLLLFFGGIGALVMFWVRRRGRVSRSIESSCGHCGYAVTGLPTFVCSECGSDLREVGINKGSKAVKRTALGEARANVATESPARAVAGQSRTLTILFTDMKDFTARTAAASRESLLGMLRVNKQVVESAVRARRGKVVKTIGDACLVTFDSATDAVLAGVEIQAAADRHNLAAGNGERLELRIGVSTGEVTSSDADLFGTAVNVAARVQNLAEAGEVYFTESTWHAMNAAEVPCTELGVRELKGIASPVRVFRADRG